MYNDMKVPYDILKKVHEKLAVLRLLSVNLLYLAMPKNTLTCVN